MSARAVGLTAGSRKRRLARSLILALLGAMVLATPTLAKAVESGSTSGTDSGVECGLYDRQTTFTTSYTIKNATPATDGQFFFYSQKLRFTDVITNPATGSFLTVSGSTNFKEIQPRLVEGTIYTWHTIEIGQFVLRDQDGTVIHRDVGLVEFSYVFDSLGDSMPGGPFLEDPTFVRAVGQHDDFDFCAVAAELLG